MAARCHLRGQVRQVHSGCRRSLAERGSASVPRLGQDPGGETEVGAGVAGMCPPQPGPPSSDRQVTSLGPREDPVQRYSGRQQPGQVRTQTSRVRLGPSARPHRTPPAKRLPLPRRPSVSVTRGARSESWQPLGSQEHGPPHACPCHLRSWPRQRPPGSQARSRGGNGRTRARSHSAVPLGKRPCPTHTRPHLGADRGRGYVTTCPPGPSSPPDSGSASQH